MPEEKGKDKGRVVYARLEGSDERRGARAQKKRERAVASPDAYGTLWQTLVPLLVGFALLVGLVLGLGYLSARKVSEASFGTKDAERRLSAMSKTLLNLRLALSRLDTEARIRGRVESGTQGGMLPPTDLRLRNEREALASLLPAFDALPLQDGAKKDD